MEGLVRAVGEGEARVNITWKGQNGDMLDPVRLDLSNEEVLAMVTEAVRNGNVPGINADGGAEFRDFVVDRFDPTEAYPFPRFAVRPKTPFGR